MKLQDLFENLTTRERQMAADIRKASRENLVVQIYSDEVYIIDDIPQISAEQFERLRQISFESGSLDKHLYQNMFMLIFDDEPTNDDSYPYDGDLSIEELTWKEFVAKMKEYFPGGGDFSE